jgi:CheY-like chemotaxis protein
MIDTLMTLDDEPIDQKLNKRIITRSALVDTLVQCNDGPSALAYLADPNNRPIDALLLDINMPGMSGFEFLEAAVARFGPRFCRVTVVMLTTSVSEADRQRAMAFEVVQDFLRKPLKLEYLERIDEMLRNRPARFTA